MSPVVFVLVYIGMLLGGLPWLRLDRTGVALLGAIALLAAGTVSLDEAWRAIDVPTIALLFGLMVLSAQLRLGGFYTWSARSLTALPLHPPRLLLALVLGVGALSAVFSNDIVCLAVAPVLVEICDRRRLDPVPFLLALMCAANVGSAATLIGNPQNMLIGQRLGLSFATYLGVAGPVALGGLLVTWAVLARQYRNRWDLAPGAPLPHPAVPMPTLDRWQTAKGLAVAGALLVVFLVTDFPREVAALAAAGILLLSRRLHSRDMLGLVDWQLLVLFAGLFVVNHALARAELLSDFVAWLTARGADPASPGWLTAWTVVLSNAVSNVPAVMLLLPLATGEDAGPLLALVSTFAGNLLIVGSIANIIVVDAAARQGIAISWRTHVRTGAWVTLGTLGVALTAIMI